MSKMYRVSGPLRGFTLVELLVGLVVGALVILAVLVAWGLSVGTTSYNIETNRLNHDLRATMQLLAEDLRRADAGSVVFNSEQTCVAFSVSPRPTKARGVCSTSPGDDPECWSSRGFRFNPNSTPPTLEMFIDQPPFLGVGPDNRCDLDVIEWVPILGGIEEGFAFNAFEARCTAQCLRVLPPGQAATGSDVVTLTGKIQCAESPRCDESFNAGDNWVELLSVDILLEGSVEVRGTPRELVLEETVFVRNHEVGP